MPNNLYQILNYIVQYLAKLVFLNKTFKKYKKSKKSTQKLERLSTTFRI